MLTDRLKQCRSFNVMDKNDGLKEKSANYDKVNNKKSSVINDFAETIDHQDLKNSFDQKEQVTKFTTKNSNGNFNNQIMNMNKTNKTETLRGNENKFHATANGFFNKTTDKLIKNSLTINT